MKIRLSGTREETAAAIVALGRVFEVLEASAPYPHRGNSRLVRVYVEVRLRAHHGAAAEVA